MKKVKFTEGGMTEDMAWYSERWVAVSDDFEDRLMQAVADEAAKPTADTLIVSGAMRRIYLDIVDGH